ncbi:MAG: P1 family peptidase [Candidatus Limnocylindria bacterium]
MRARDLGIAPGLMPPGPLNAITDVAGLRVGHVTLVRGDGPLVVGQGPVRTGVTVILPRDGEISSRPLFAGSHTLNGNGEMTGLEWVRESGMLTTPIGLTNTHSVGVVRDALVAASVAAGPPGEPRGGPRWSLPVVAETWDGLLNDVDGQHVRAEHVMSALAAASGGPVPEGSVGGGTGMKAFGFKAGIGTASRVVDASAESYRVGVLVQANHGRRERLLVDGVPVGQVLPLEVIPGPDPAVAEGGSIIAVVATDAPLLPHQCRRLAQRAALGVARGGGGGEHSSGDIFLAFATGNRELPPAEAAPGPAAVRMLPDEQISQLFWATIEATEEAVLNALVAAETMTGRDGITVHSLPHDRLLQVMDRYGRGPA